MTGKKKALEEDLRFSAQWKRTLNERTLILEGAILKAIFHLYCGSEEYINKIVKQYISWVSQFTNSQIIIS